MTSHSIIREAVFRALLDEKRHGTFINESLSKWQSGCHPSNKDYRLAQEIAYGTMRMQRALDHMAKQLTEQKLKAKPKERLILQTALYQHYYMDRIPLYAIVNESVALAKKYCHESFARFLNAMLRKLDNITLSLPEGDHAEDLSIRYSYPEEYVQALLTDHGLETTKQILETGNQPPILMARLRPGHKNSDYQYLIKEPVPIVVLDEALPSREYYIQNATPAYLITELSRHLTTPPTRILDMCASPGGKAIAIHDLFPTAFLHVNDVSEEKIAQLRENLAYYGIDAHYTTLRGQEINSDNLYDLIIIDAPCSNTGVLNKRPEARWRLTAENLKALEATQRKLIEHARTLLAPGGQIWYLTCSILQQENEIQGNDPSFQKTILPNAEGWDGGFGAILFPYGVG